MSQQKQPTTGPCYIDPFKHPNGNIRIMAEQCTPIAVVPEHQREDARRLAACWNACQGIPTEALECQTKKQLTAQLIGINEEMRATMELLLDPMINAYAHQDQLEEKCACRDCVRAKARYAIIKAKEWQP